MDRLEQVLERHLGRTAAPEELWDRIHNPPVPQSGNPRQQIAWALAATLLVLAVLWGFNARGERLEFRSAKAAQIHDWIKASTGLDVPLAAQPPASVRLICARVINGDAEIDYRVGNHDATLLVSRTGTTSTGDAGHRFLKSESRVASWSAGSQSYTLSGNTPADLRAACLLCHG